MRLNISFLALLMTATLGVGLELKELPLARDGDIIARVIASAAAPVLVVAIALLARIISRVEDLKRSGKGLS